MVTDAVLPFVDILREHELLDETQLRQLEEEAGRYNSLKELAKSLVQRGWLTRFQAKLILTGRAAELRLGVYRLLDRLGEGGMGQVYKALHVAMNRTVALKVVRPELVADSKTLKRFRREVQSAAQLSHPHIVTVFDASQVGDTHFLAMEYIDGIDIADLVRTAGPLPVADACDYIRQAALGLQHAHERGLIHRDIKPSNLLVTRSPAGMVKILDMGLARPAQFESSTGPAHTALTMDGTVVGTPDFMAPEQAKNARAVDHRCDIYSLGCTLYYMLAGRTPFSGRTAMEKLIQHQMDQPPALELIRADVPPALLAILHSMMAKQPEDRFANASQVASAIEPFCREGGIDMAAPTIALEAINAVAATPTEIHSESRFQFEPTENTIVPIRPRRQRSQSTVWIVALAGVAALVCGVVLLAIGNRVLRARRNIASTEPSAAAAKPQPNDAPKPATPSAPPHDWRSFIQHDAAVAFVLNVPSFLDAPLVQKHFMPLLKPVFEQLNKLQIDPAKQFDRVVVSTPASDSDRTLIVLSGKPLGSGIKQFLQLLPHEEKRFADGSALTVYEMHETGKPTKYLAVFADSHVAVTSHRASLAELHERWHGRRAVGEQWPTRLKDWKSDAPIMLAVGPKFAPDDAALASLGVHFFRCEVRLAPAVSIRCVAEVENADNFQRLWRRLLESTAKNVFDIRRTAFMAIWRNSQFQTATKLPNGRYEVPVHVDLNGLESNIVVAYVARQMQQR